MVVGFAIEFNIKKLLPGFPFLKMKIYHAFCKNFI